MTSKKSIFLNRKTDIFVKIYLGLFWTEIAGFLIILVIALIHPLQNYLTKTPKVSLALLQLGEIWLILLALMIPLGIILLGYWSIRYKESGIRFPVTRSIYTSGIPFTGTPAIIIGFLYLGLGLFLLWAEVGIIIPFFCDGHEITQVCNSLPKFIKFF